MGAGLRIVGRPTADSIMQALDGSLSDSVTFCMEYSVPDPRIVHTCDVCGTDILPPPWRRVRRRYWKR